MNKILSILLACSMVLPYTNFLTFANEDETVLAKEPVLTIEKETCDHKLNGEPPVKEIQEVPETVSVDEALDESPYSAKYGKLIASGNRGTNWYLYIDGTLVIEAGELIFSSVANEYADYIENIVIEPANGTDMLILPPDCSWMFTSYNFLETVDTLHMDTSNVRNMANMFLYCYNLKELDLSNFNTSNVYSMVSMFGCCHSLEKLDISNFDTSNVRDMESLFLGCSMLENLDLSHFDTTNVENMESMFSGCSSLKKLALVPG